MAGVLHLVDPVVTGEVLSQQHRGQDEVAVSPRSVITPTGWDYIREHGLRVVRQSRAGRTPAREPEGQIREVPPAAADGEKVIPEGRYDHPDRPYGCETDEFGSGFAEPESCESCEVRRQQGGKPGAACRGCNRQKQDVQRSDAGYGDADVEALIQVITDRVMARLGGA